MDPRRDPLGDDDGAVVAGTRPIGLRGSHA